MNRFLLYCECNTFLYKGYKVHVKCTRRNIYEEETYIKVHDIDIRCKKLSLCKNGKKWKSSRQAKPSRYFRIGILTLPLCSWLLRRIEVKLRWHGAFSYNVFKYRKDSSWRKQA